jgi:hypothetical protein
MDKVLDQIDDAIERVMFSHHPLDNDSRCSCGARNNMDGDVLDAHRMGLVSDAVRGVFADQKIIGFIVDDPSQVKPRIYTDADAEVWVDGYDRQPVD